MPDEAAAELPLDEKVALLGEALGSEVPHAFGGALALAYYAEPRATHDIDLNLFVPSDAIDPVLGVLERLGVTLDPGDTRDRVRSDGQIRLPWGRTPLDLFFAFDPFHDACAARRRRVPFGPDELWILAPEDLVVCKVAFDRRKDWLDIEQVLLTTGGDLDVTDVRRWLDHLLGADDRRRRRFDEAVADILGGPAPA